jgi:hypothetical protein
MSAVGFGIEYPRMYDRSDPQQRTRAEQSMWQSCDGAPDTRALRWTQMVRSWTGICPILAPCQRSRRLRG